MSMAAVVLAGGESRRMGQDKAMLNWQSGETLLAHQVGLLAGVVSPEAVFVSGDRPGFRCIADQEVGRGPLGGILSVIAKFCQQGLFKEVLFLPVDMPLVGRRDLLRLVHELKGADACCFEESQMPVIFGQLPKVLQQISIMQKGSSGKKFSLLNLYDRLTVTRISDPSARSCLNLNSPKEFHDALSTTNEIA